MTVRLDPKRLELLLLARLSATDEKPLQDSELMRSLFHYVEHAVSTAGWREICEATLAALAKRGQITRDPLALGEAGRGRVRNVLGLQDALSWPEIESRHLTAKALGLPASSPEVQARMGDDDGLRASILHRRHALAVPDSVTLDEAIDAWVWRQLGVETDTPLTVEAVKEHFLRRALDTGARMSLAELVRLFVARAADTHDGDPDALRLSLLRQWLCESHSLHSHLEPELCNLAETVFERGKRDRPRGTDAATNARAGESAPLPATSADPGHDDVAAAPGADAAGQPGSPVIAPPATSQEPARSPRDPRSPGFDLAALVREIHDVAARTSEGRVGDDLVLISAVWRALAEHPIRAGMTLDRFKSHLVNAKRKNLVSLHRAAEPVIMPDQIDHAELRESEIRYLTAVFHLIQTAK